MSWQAYRVIFRLRSAMHIGRAKVGNVELTYPYLPGRTLWGALTARLTRDRHQGRRTLPLAGDYEVIGQQVNGGQLAFTYFYPAIEEDGGLCVSWSWADQSAFRYRFLSSYASTALDYGANSAEEGSLHETEFLVPHTRDGLPVYMMGYVFARGGGVPGWQQALTRLQVGGERGYGWGRLERVSCDQQQGTEVPLFGGLAYKAFLDGDVVTITIPAEQPLFAHTVPHPKVKVKGTVEPLVGRMWGMARHGESSGFGQRISAAQVCWMPGSVLAEDATVQIGPYGIWEARASAP